jgi:TetR/AcrR family transcriptional regulator
MRLIVEADLLLPAALEFRRRAAVEYLGQALFIDRAHGARLAAKVLADTPMPQPVEPRGDPFRNLKIEPGNMEAGQTSPK